MSSVSKEIFNGIIYCTEASKVWTDLQERFDKICGSRIFSLHRQISHLSQGSSPISMYFSTLKKLWDEYSSLVTLPSCGCATAKAYLAHDQHLRLLQFLMGLNESYSHIRSQLLMMDPLPSVNQAYSILSQEESHRSVLSSQPIMEMPTIAFYTSSHKPLELVKCENCNITGQSKDQCFCIIGYPPGHKLYKKFPQAKSSRFTPRNPKISAHTSVNTSSDFGLPPDVSNGAPNMAHSFTDAQYQQLLRFLDQPSSSGATANLAGTSSSLQTPQSCASSAGSVKLPNGNTTPILSYGSVQLSPSCTLPKVLFVPDFNFNLISIVNSSKITISLLFSILISVYFRTS
ncbi:uncharacterized protein [Henckelia pumila]|uniref:uncharacterized protein isoform X2 n=1 Tax=Henckelia pumila TaxID=405737 RepID=UPI003C6DC802